jgi:hypothetical protein
MDRGYSAAQRLFERFDGFSLGQEIIDVVQNMNLGIATQPIHYGCQGASLEMARKCGYEGSASAIFETYRVAADVCNTGNWKSN